MIYVLRNFLLSLIAYFHDYVFTLCLYTHIINVFSWFCFHEYDICFIDFECWWSCDLHVFYGIYFCFIPYLKDFVLVYKFFIKLVRILHCGRVFQQTIFSNLFLKTLPITGGWLGDHAVYVHIENLFKHVHEMGGR